MPNASFKSFVAAFIHVIVNVAVVVAVIVVSVDVEVEIKLSLTLTSPLQATLVYLQTAHRTDRILQYDVDNYLISLTIACSTTSRTG